MLNNNSANTGQHKSSPTSYNGYQHTGRHFLAALSPKQPSMPTPVAATTFSFTDEDET